MSQNLLHIIQREASENSQSTPQPDILRNGERSDSGDGKDHGSESGDCDECYACEERAAEVEVFFLLSGRADEGDRTHHGDGVETGAGDDGGWCHEEHWGEEGTLGCVECCPECVFWKIAIIISTYSS